MKIKRDFFTILELMIVITIIVILVSILLPSLNQVRSKGKSITCTNNLKQIGTGYVMYAGDNMEYSPTLGRGGQNIDVFWTYLLSGYIGYQIDKNITLPALRPAIPNYACPSAVLDPTDLFSMAGRNNLTYGYNLRVGDFYSTGNYLTTKINKLKNPSTKFMFMDAVPKKWWLFSSTPAYIDVRHTKKVNIVMGDGHVEGLNGYVPPLADTDSWRISNWWPSGEWNKY